MLSHQNNPIDPRSPRSDGFFQPQNVLIGLSTLTGSFNGTRFCHVGQVGWTDQEIR